ncbi:heavy metal translocating P-type ATPase [Candidatus Albibeggiatoa sp. nov. NOAA]|uniref:heavy metal translocating P-type ATPase n=1 Tax=Candidatus Albibeggiatoa sp. nov. NOAA TaxID=3162724 RepID=UPI003302B19A|nr:heavy metal translocating P-type ATPase [Thiotrichaceae bacterium]
MIHLAVFSLFAVGVGTAFVKERLDNKKSVEPQNLESDNQSIVPSNNNQIVAEQEEQELNYFTQLSVVGTVCSVAGVFYPPLLIPSLILLGYACAELFKDAAIGLQQGKIRLSILDSIAIFTGLAAKQYFFSSLEVLVYFIAMKMRFRSRHQTSEHVKSIFSQRPPTVWIVQEGVEVNIPLDKVCLGDHVIFQAGETLAIDGVIVEGTAIIDQRLLTGEEQPEEKTIGDTVYAATTLVAGRIVVAAKQSGDSTLAATVGRVLEETDNYIEELESQGEQIANRSVLPTIGLASVALLARSPITMFVVLSSNFSEIMRTTVPLSMLNFLRLASNNGLLIKDGRSLDQLTTIDTVVFDKTGTLTLEQPLIGKIYPVQGYDEQTVLYYAAAAEHRQSHPIARAILDAAEQQQIVLPKIDQAEYEIGYGIRVKVDEQVVLVGSQRFLLEQAVNFAEDFADVEQQAHQQGYGLVYIAVNNSLAGVIELHPAVRPETLEVVQALQQQGIAVHILSGDHTEPVRNLAEQLGVDGFFAETLPEDKANIIRQMQEAGKQVCFIGDGLNDAIALKTATVSVSLQDASQLAVDSAQIVLLQKDLRQILNALDLAKQYHQHQTAVVATSVAVPSALSAGGAILLGWGIATTFKLYIAGAVTGLSGAMLPALSNKPTTFNSNLFSQQDQHADDTKKL